MTKIYRNSFFPFAVIAFALILCIPLLGIEKHADALAVKTSASSSAVTDPLAQDTAVDLQLKNAGLVNLRQQQTTFDINMRYGTVDNLTGRALYQSQRAYLRPETAQKLVEANNEFLALGYRIKIWDAYRPLSVQKVLYTASGHSWGIANPAEGSNHNRGTAVDITLERLDGTALDMPTDFDTFTVKAFITQKSNCTATELQNRELLGSVMIKHGFNRIDCEWWHFDDSDAGKYTLIDIPF